MNKNIHPSPTLARPGWSLIDAILSIALVSLLGVLVAGLASLTRSNARATQSIAAASLGNEQLAAIQRLAITSVPDQVAGDPINTLYNAGPWTVRPDTTSLDTLTPCPPPTAGQHCGANVLDLPANAAFVNSESGRLQFPADAYGDTVLQASWKVMNDSPANWVFGMYFRMRDLRNGYRLRIGSPTVDFQAGGAVQNIILEKISNGTASTLYLSGGVVAISTNTWMTLRLTMTGDTFTVTKDGAAFIPATTDSAAPFLTGRAALAAWNGTHVRVDDVTTIDPAGCTASPNACWDFEAEDALPTAWTRFGGNDLPDATPTTYDDNVDVTIEAWPAGETDLKRITVVVNWVGVNGPQSETVIGYIRKDGIGT